MNRLYYNADEVMEPETAFVTGLPRSRTAWFSNYLSHGNASIIHDGFRLLNAIDDFPIQLKKEFPYSEVIGNSDPANILFWERIVEWFPHAKWVVVRRPFEEVFESCNRIWKIERQSLWAMSDKLNELIDALNPMVVDFHGITPQVAMDVAAYLGIDAGNLKRAEQLCRMNVQIEPSFLKAAIKDFVDKPPQWMSKE